MKMCCKKERGAVPPLSKEITEDELTEKDREIMDLLNLSAGELILGYYADR